jgi:ectoine hydroxylase-related dioxygenase (phytanoyl-CoA dioxygenase family)
MTTDMTDPVVQQFHEAGAVTIDTPLTAQEIATAAAAMDRLLPFQAKNYRPSLTCSYDNPALLDIIQHPFFEEVARRVLQAEQVHFFQTAIVTAYPEPDTPFSFWQHVDIQYRLSDFQSVPKQILCSFFLWLTDVNERRAPMMFRPGSHLLIARQRQDDPDGKDDPPRVAPVPLERLPPLPYAAPIPLTAKAGQVSVLTTAAVHGASVNVDREPRKNLVFTFAAAGVTIGLPPHEEMQKQEYHQRLRRRLRPERAHILPQ